MTVIQSVQNEKIKELRQLQRDKNLFWWEGERFFTEIIKTNFSVKTLVFTETFLEKYHSDIKKVEAENSLIVSEKVFKSISTTETPQGIGGISWKPNFHLNDILAEKKPLFYLAGLQDPGNVGAIVRIAEAFEFGGILYERRGASPFCEKAVRSSAGSILRVKVLEGNISLLDSLQELGFNLFLLTPHIEGAEDIANLEKTQFKRAVFVLGQEGKGLDIEISKAKNVYIPISKDVESLNVAVAAGIVAYLWGRC